MNEYIFLLQIACIGICTLASLYLGREALCALIITQTILANLFVSKQIMFLQFHITPTDAFTLGAVIALNLMQEYYGPKAARSTLWISFATTLFFNIMAQLHLWYIPSIYDTSNPHFMAILYNSPRIIAASLTAYLLSQNIEYSLYAFFKRKYGSKNIFIRSALATFPAQLCDTLIFSLLGLYGIVERIDHIILVSYMIKVIAFIASAPTIWLSKHVATKKYTYEYF